MIAPIVPKLSLFSLSPSPYLADPSHSPITSSFPTIAILAGYCNQGWSSIMGHFRRHKSLLSSKAVFELLCQSQEDGEGRSSAIGQIWLQSPSSPVAGWYGGTEGTLKDFFAPSPPSLCHTLKGSVRPLLPGGARRWRHGLTVRPNGSIAAIERNDFFGDDAMHHASRDDYLTSRFLEREHTLLS